MVHALVLIEVDPPPAELVVQPTERHDVEPSGTWPALMGIDHLVG